MKSLEIKQNICFLLAIYNSKESYLHVVAFYKSLIQILYAKKQDFIWQELKLVHGEHLLMMFVKKYQNISWELVKIQTIRTHEEVNGSSEANTVPITRARRGAGRVRSVKRTG